MEQEQRRVEKVGVVEDYGSWNPQRWNGEGGHDLRHDCFAPHPPGEDLRLRNPWNRRA